MQPLQQSASFNGTPTIASHPVNAVDHRGDAQQSQPVGTHSEFINQNYAPLPKVPIYNATGHGAVPSVSMVEERDIVGYHHAPAPSNVGVSLCHEQGDQSAYYVDMQGSAGAGYYVQQDNQRRAHFYMDGDGLTRAQRYALEHNMSASSVPGYNVIVRGHYNHPLHPPHGIVSNTPTLNTHDVHLPQHSVSDLWLRRHRERHVQNAADPMQSQTMRQFGAELGNNIHNVDAGHNERSRRMHGTFDNTSHGDENLPNAPSQAKTHYPGRPRPVSIDFYIS